MFTDFDRMLIDYCSPTLASLKIANLFSLDFRKMSELEALVRVKNESLNEKGIYLKILSNNEKRALIYVYRKGLLQETLNRAEIKEFLVSFGYVSFQTEEALSFLSDRFLSGTAFPHEIGIFLGYPLHDVENFIIHKGSNYRCSGCWKVYKEECEALRYFERFEKCRNLYTKLFLDGHSLDKLTVKAV